MKAEDQKKVVLVVDDAPANIRMVNEILHDRYKVRIATTGAKGLELASATPNPDLILLDVIMPGMDGYDVCKHLKAGAGDAGHPGNLPDGQTETTDETRGFEVGAVDYIHKPFSPAVVAARVQTHLALRETREQLARQLDAIRSELETARQIQLSILPQEIPQFTGLDIAARYIPMTSVAGDFYDFIVVDDRRIGILVADVSGHGMPAALIASMLKSGLCGAVGARLRSGGGAVGIEPGLIREVSGTLRHRGICADRHREADTPLRGRRTSASFVERAAGGSNVQCAGERTVPGILPASRVFRGGGCFPRGRLGVALHGWNSGNDERVRGAVWGGAAETFLDEHAGLPAGSFAGALLDQITQFSGRAAGEDPDDDITLVAVHFQAGD